MTPGDFLFSSEIVRYLDLFGVFLTGIVGGAYGRRLRFDAVGFASVAIISALGGGILRDLILAYGTPAAFAGPWYLCFALAGATFAFLVKTEGRKWRVGIGVMDAAVIGTWAAVGVAKSLNYGLSVLPAIMLGVVYAVGGGAIRDIAVGKIPEIFGGGPLYATAALLTSVLTAGCILLPVPGETVFLAIAAGAATAILAKWLRWRLPQHDDWSVTLSAAQLKSLVRRVRRSEQKRVEAELQEAIDEIS
ncbi:TRIC cation channel family protein [Dermabacteraceae bacterium TAE3-ERU27]|nr:TRIC cation channel family protein [Dermabacteraceae bacterium TAE3-ERU27]